MPSPLPCGAAFCRYELRPLNLPSSDFSVTYRELWGDGCRLGDSAKFTGRIVSPKRSAILRLPLLNFPDGLRGAALLWLRVAVALTLARIAAEYLEADRELPGILIDAAALLLGIGLFTPGPALLIAVQQIVSMIIHPPRQDWSGFLVASILIALMVLGPGAYSIDRWLFGRKRLTIGRPGN
jgi:hypothetical protein